MKYNTSTEYKKAIKFLDIGCKCGCFAKIPREKFAEMRESFQALTRSEQDAFLMAQLIAMDGGTMTASRRLKKKYRTNKKTFYCWNCNTRVCQKTYFNMLGIGRTYLENIRNHLINNGLISRIHGNVKRMPQWKTKMVIDKNVAEAVKNFLENYAEVHGLPSPGRNVNRITRSLIFLPAETSYKSVHHDFLAGLERDSILNSLKYDAFRKLWHQLMPYIQIMSPRTDLCDMCQHFRNGLQYNTHKEEEAKDILIKYKEHLAKAKLERNYYNQNTKLATEQRKLVDENYLVVEGKGPNGTLSMVFNGIKRLNKVICGYYESIELNFMVPGHTKFKCDGSFGLIKKLYRNTTVDCMDHVVEVVKKSSPTRLNKAQCYEGGKGFQYLDLNSVLGIFFKKLSGLQKYRHFLFNAANPGIVKVQMNANDYKRQEYLYQNIRPFVRDKFKDITCPKPI